MAVRFPGSDEGRKRLYGNEYAGSGTGRRGADARQDVDFKLRLVYIRMFNVTVRAVPDVVFEVDRTVTEAGRN